jgi:hypothetical protein
MCYYWQLESENIAIKKEELQMGNDGDGLPIHRIPASLISQMATTTPLNAAGTKRISG